MRHSKDKVELPQINKRSVSEKRLMKLQKIGFELQAQKLRKQYENKYLFNGMKMRSKSNRRLLTQINQEKIGHFLKPTKIISVTAHKWVIYDYYTNRYIRGYRAKDKNQLGPFSKLLVFCAVNTLIQKNKLDIQRFQTIVTESVLKLNKNRCNLKADDIISLQDLLHLMIMQQSDAYQNILAVNVGAFLSQKRKSQYYSVFDNKDSEMKKHLKAFYQLVNSYCNLLKLENITYVQSDPALRKQKNKGSASDIAVLSIQCLKIPLFMQIINKLTHSVNIKYISKQGGLAQKSVQITSYSILNKFLPYSSVCRNWQQNNFMNSQCSIYCEPGSGIQPIVVVLLGCYGPMDREKDIQQVVEWYIKNIKQENKERYESKEKQKDERKSMQLKDERKSMQLMNSQEKTKKIEESISKKLQLGTTRDRNKKIQGIVRDQTVRNRRIKTNL